VKAYLLAAAILLSLALGVMWRSVTPDLNTVTIHKTQDRLPVACQEGAQ
jgi:hypothetical protein